MPTDSSNRSFDDSHVPTLFAEFIARVEIGEAIDFDAFCDAHPVQAVGLRKARDDWNRARSALNEAFAVPEHESFAERLEKEYGATVDPGISLDRRPGSDGRSAVTESKAAASELLNRLHERSTPHSRYEFEGEVAHGAMGNILRVWDDNLRRHLAMKVIRDRDEVRRGGTPNVDVRQLSRFLEEAQVTGQLDHPGIVPVHELGIDRTGRVYFTMKLVKGRNFEKILDLVFEGKEEWNETRALGVIVRTCEAVAYAHSKGVIHRDLKPSNVMVGSFGEVFVMDWGLARVMGQEDSHDLRIKPDPTGSQARVHTERSERRGDTPVSPLVTMDGDIVGTPAYMSPEQAGGDIDALGARSDVYALGAMLYHLLARAVPYTSSSKQLTSREILDLVRQGPPRPVLELNPAAPRELVDVCEKAMARDPDQRYGDAMQLAKDIEAFLDRRPVGAHVPSVGYALRLAVERNKPVAWTTIASVVLFLVLAGVSLTRIRDARAATESSRQARTDVLAARGLVAQETSLYPATPDRADGMKRWIDSVNDLLRREDHYASKSSTVGTEVLNDVESDSLVDDLKRLRALLPDIERRFDRASTLERMSIDDEQANWNTAIADIAASPAYHGLRIRPQLGLVPLWKNAQSGLWEFWHLNSGTRPVMADMKEEHFEDDAENGIVLVLIPGGAFLMGSPGDEYGRDVWNENAHGVTLPSFFIAKFEITQAQWERVMRTNPARYSPADGAGQYTPLNPVESVTWNQCDEFARRLGLSLPLEAQWEYACRAGTSTAYSWGDDFDCLEDKENILDQSAGVSSFQSAAPWSDGFKTHAPVGSFAPNAYGLHDMAGNVSEWCADLYQRELEKPDESRTRIQWNVELRVFRGGSWYQPPQYVGTQNRIIAPMRSAFRQFDNAAALNQARGVRLARELEP
jgi:formylglycine-generating enzyme required for sulfatase activity/serine/threonine protein kinase